MARDSSIFVVSASDRYFASSMSFFEIPDSPRGTPIDDQGYFSRLNEFP